MKSFDSYTSDPRPVDALSRAQISLILGLEPILEHAGLVLTCPRCAADGHGTLTTDNAREDPVWKIDCHCRRRRMARADSQPMPACSQTYLLVPDLLAPVGLDVRCPSPQCLLLPLTVRQTLEGLLVTCHCGGSYLFRQHGQSVKPH